MGRVLSQYEGNILGQHQNFVRFIKIDSGLLDRSFHFLYEDTHIAIFLLELDSGFSRNISDLGTPWSCSYAISFLGGL